MSGDRKIERVKKGEKQVRQVELGEEAAGGGVGGISLQLNMGGGPTHQTMPVL